MKKYTLNGETKSLERIVLRDGDTDIYAPSEAQVKAAGWEEAEEDEARPVVREVSVYEDKVVALIRERYGVDDELAILRQRDAKPEEWQEYYNYCEECKTRAKKALGLLHEEVEIEAPIQEDEA